MPDRPGRMFKVLCRPMESRRAMQVLERLGWAGPAGRVEAFLSRFEESFRSLRLAVGVTAQGIAPRIGFELSRGEAASFSRPGTGGWAPLLTGSARSLAGCLPVILTDLSTPMIGRDADHPVAFGETGPSRQRGQD